MLKEVFAAEVAKTDGPDAGRIAAGALDMALSQFGVQQTTMASNAMRTGTYVACFSEDPASELMWAHYADAHQGFCVEYDFTMINADDLRYKLLWPVIYSSEKFPLVVNGPPEPRNFTVWNATLAAIHKHPRWEYEREWRIVVALGDPPMPPWDLGKPNRLILGQKIQARPRTLLTAIANDYKIPLAQMQPVGDFDLEARPVE